MQSQYKYKIKNYIKFEKRLINRKTTGNMRKAKRNIKDYYSLMNSDEIVIEILNKNKKIKKINLPFKTYILKEGLNPIFFSFKDDQCLLICSRNSYLYFYYGVFYICSFV